MSSNSALETLMQGNARYISSSFDDSRRSAGRRAETVGAQHPFAAVITCADSRVPPEIIFDQGIGDIFVVRVAGNVADDAVIGSVELAVDHCGVALVMVLGHTNCGAVKAAVSGGAAPGRTQRIVEMIMPAVERARTMNGDLVDNAMRENVALVVSQLRATPPILKDLADRGRLAIIGAVYDIESGAVSMLDER